MSANRLFRWALPWCLALAASAARAQVPAASDPHERLFAILAAPEVEQQVVTAMVGEMRTQFAADPNFAELEAECPGAIDVMTATVAATMREPDNAQALAYKAEYLAVIRENMPADQAAQAADFFGSDLGQRFLVSVSSSMNFSNAMADAIGNGGGEVSREAYEKDRNAITRNAVQKIDAADLYQASLTIGSSEWGKTLARLRPQLAALQYAQFNLATTPEEDAALERLFVDALEKHLAGCGLELQPE